MLVLLEMYVIHFLLSSADGKRTDRTELLPWQWEADAMDSVLILKYWRLTIFLILGYYLWVGPSSGNSPTKNYIVGWKGSFEHNFCSGTYNKAQMSIPRKKIWKHMWRAFLFVCSKDIDETHSQDQVPYTEALVDYWQVPSSFIERSTMQKYF